MWPNRQSLSAYGQIGSLSAYGQIGRVCPHMARSAESVRIWPDRQSLSAYGQIGRVCPHVARSAESVRIWPDRQSLSACRAKSAVLMRPQSVKQTLLSQMKFAQELEKQGCQTKRNGKREEIVSVVINKINCQYMLVPEKCKRNKLKSQFTKYLKLNSRFTGNHFEKPQLVDINQITFGKEN